MQVEGHSTMELTMQVYALVALDTKEEAVNQLPDFTVSEYSCHAE